MVIKEYKCVNFWVWIEGNLGNKFIYLCRIYCNISVRELKIFVNVELFR